MRLVFADTAYWIARILRTDQWHEAAAEARKSLGDGVKLVTTTEVLIETLGSFTKPLPETRGKALEMVRALLEDKRIEVIPPSHASFMNGLRLYEKRLDKGYSLVDCISMNLMRERKISDALTSDHHFEQEGFRVLIRK